ncbi:hypothetical protein [Streptomyces sp. NRRL S-87]|uniref:hypothetical protein n=1 Tax=Streptomyces sp. NRRL S-87 TaxID=1463920 RepID=UPI00056A48C2|nr:hypothetical protein [Streptomyces sp. NRRL S-87]
MTQYSPHSPYAAHPAHPVHSVHPSRPARSAARRGRDGGEGSFAELLGASARMARHWAVPAEPRPAPVSPTEIHGVRVPTASARLIAGTAQYGD